jgi:hypothetical protein
MALDRPGRRGVRYTDYYGGSGDFMMKSSELLVLLAVALLPAIVPIAIAYVRRTTNRKAVLLVALLTSWTCAGWVVAIVLAAIGKPEASLEQPAA